MGIPTPLMRQQLIDDAGAHATQLRAVEGLPPLGAAPPPPAALPAAAGRPQAGPPAPAPYGHPAAGPAGPPRSDPPARPGGPSRCRKSSPSMGHRRLRGELRHRRRRPSSSRCRHPWPACSRLRRPRRPLRPLPPRRHGDP